MAQGFFHGPHSSLKFEVQSFRKVQKIISKTQRLKENWQKNIQQNNIYSLQKWTMNVAVEKEIIMVKASWPFTWEFVIA